MRSQVLRQMVVGGPRGIGRGIDWKWRELEGGQSMESALVAEHREGWFIYSSVIFSMKSGKADKHLSLRVTLKNTSFEILTTD